MRRIGLVLCAAVGLAVVGRAGAEEAKPAAEAEKKPRPPLASDEEAKAALERFKASFKGNDVDRKAAALFAVAKVQHPDVVAELGKHLAHRSLDLRTVAAMAMADQRALPGLAGPRLVTAMAANSGDAVFVMTAVDGIEALEYRGAVTALVDLLKHRNHAVKKHALMALAGLREMRAMDALLALLKDVKIDEGYSWEGGEVNVDTGAAGDADQRAAESEYAARYGGNEGRGRAGGARVRDIGEALLLALKELTGQQFSKSAQIREWAEKNATSIAETQAALSKEQAAQEAEAKAAVEARKARAKK
jgi:hypothetical protein